MPASINRDDVQKLLDEGAQLLDVLPAAEYEEFHLPGAISIPLKNLDQEATAGLGRDAPVIVY